MENYPFTPSYLESCKNMKNKRIFQAKMCPFYLLLVFCSTKKILHLLLCISLMLSSVFLQLKKK